MELPAFRPRFQRTADAVLRVVIGLQDAYDRRHRPAPVHPVAACPSVAPLPAGASAPAAAGAIRG
jgi:hypothetical protein